ncbi:MAG TPA: thiamine-phosphate kinase [Bryobacteraceae bacterium]|jgi:thiamine-monophosphate kinase|nr:thiamine-phosphate kinase [Bryobacteraceae bacterium]
MNELELVERLRRLSSPSRDLVLGIGDDCAIYRPRAGEELLFTTDQMIENVHFTRAQSAASIGERALARSLSDIAAMGGEPRFCLVALAASQTKWIEDFYRGLLRLAKRTGVTLAGGDLARDEKFHCDVMVCGSVPRGTALRRDGAHAGDLIFVSGRLGRLWDRKIQPRLALGQSLCGMATSCIDLSDGLSLDLHRLCMASGVAAEIDRLPVLRGSTEERALHGGEDYELLFTLPEGVKAPRGVTRIGRAVRGVAGQIHFKGRLLKPRGYDHFRNKA